MADSSKSSAESVRYRMPNRTAAQQKSTTMVGPHSDVRDQTCSTAGPDCRACLARGWAAGILAQFALTRTIRYLLDRRPGRLGASLRRVPLPARVRRPDRRSRPRPGR